MFFLKRIFVWLKMFFKPKKNCPFIEGNNSLERVVNHLKMNGYKKIVILTSKSILENSSFNMFIEKLKRDKISFSIYDGINKEPTLETVQKVRLFVNSCMADALVAIGGSGIIDTAKIISVTGRNPSKSFSSIFAMPSILINKIPLIVAMTVTGGACENNDTAFIYDNEKHILCFEKLALVPSLVVFDPTLLCNVPDNVISYSVLDTMTKAIESYVSCLNFLRHKENAPMAIKMIFDNFEKSLQHDENAEMAKMKLLRASFLTGLAYQSERGGYATSLAYQIASNYGVHFGEAASLVLVKILKLEKEKIVSKLANLADYCFFTDTNMTVEEKANVFIQNIEKLITLANITPKINFAVGDFKKIVEGTIYSTLKRNAPAKKISETELYDLLQELKDR